MHMDVCLETREREYWERPKINQFFAYLEKERIEESFVIMLEIAMLYFLCERCSNYFCERPLMIIKSLAVGPKGYPV